MKKLKKLLRVSWLLMQKPYLLNKILEDPNIYKEKVSKHGFASGLPFVDITALFPAFDAEVNPFSFMEGGSLPTDIALLILFAKGMNNCHYFEIGTWRGESVANVARVAEKCVTLNLSADEMRKLGLPEEYISQHCMFSEGISNVTHISANSLSFDFSPFYGKFDLVFVDGDHHYESIVSDTQNAFRLLRDENSVIVWHDSGNSPVDNRWEVVSGILDGAPVDTHKNIYRIANTLCAVYASKKLPVKPDQEVVMPGLLFSVFLKTNNLNKK
jgi:predicted O-methyltransferase YrrM